MGAESPDVRLRGAAAEPRRAALRAACRRRRTALAALVLGVTLAVLASPSTAKATSSGGLEAFRARHGQAWQLQTDPRTGRPRRLVGGALDWRDALSTSTRGSARGSEEALVARARAFLAENAGLLGLDAEALRPAEPAVVAANGGRLRVVHFDFAPHRVPVDGGRVLLTISAGHLIHVHAVGTEAVTADPVPTVSASRAIDVALAATGLRVSDLARPPRPRLIFLREADDHRLAWEMSLSDELGGRHLLARIDARTGELVGLLDATLEACPGPATPPGRVLGGVRVERADDPERVELLRGAFVDGLAQAEDGLFRTPEPPLAGELVSRAVRIDCIDCTSPTPPATGPDAAGDLDFGTGGRDEIGNGRSTPADRTAFFHLEGVRRMARRWLDLRFFDEPMDVRTNLPGSCAAAWNQDGMRLYRSSETCAATGELRDVIVHEWGHALDDADGFPIQWWVEKATAEGVADILAILRSRDACLGDSFWRDREDWTSDTCSGVRHADEWSTGHWEGRFSYLSLENVREHCPESFLYPGVLGLDAHCEAEMLGQVFWHLVEGLRDGVSPADGASLPDGPLGEEEAWQVAEELFFTALPLIGSWASSMMQDTGPSAHEAVLVADDEGDGLANGTPHAAAINEAFAHHGLTEFGLAPPDTEGCAAPGAPMLSALALLDGESGLQRVRLNRDAAPVDAWRVLRADDPGDAFLDVSGPLAGDLLLFDDRSVLPGRTYRYLAVAEESACASAPSEVAVVTTGSELRIATVRMLDDAALGGNADGSLEAGETADLEIELVLVGERSVNGVRALLSSPDAELAVLDPGPVNHGRLDPGVPSAGSSLFRVRAAVDAPGRVVLDVQAEVDEGCLRARHFLEIAGPDLVLASRVVDDGAGGDGDGRWEAGETIELTVDLRNQGRLAAAAPVEGELRFRGPPPSGIVLTRPSATWPTIASGASASSDPPGFELSADLGLGPRTKVFLELEVSVAGRFHRVFDLALTAGGFPAGELEWEFDSAGWVEGTPLVLQLTDDDGDGRITACDTPDIVIPEFGAPRDELIALSGDTGEELWRYGDEPCAHAAWSSSFAGGDIDGDGWNEIVMISGYELACAFDSFGRVKWQSDVLPSCLSLSRVTPQIRDLDADGLVEVLAGCAALRGADGSVAWRSDRRTARVLVGDLDLDGLEEVIGGPGEVRRSDGSLASVSFFGYDSRYAGVLANLDDDPYPEIVLTEQVEIRAFEHDGTPKWSRTDLPSSGDGPACAGDFDGDGRAEVALPTHATLFVFDDDGSTLWTSPLQDETINTSGCSVFDFEGDGRPELIYKDQNWLRIYDGADGEVLWALPLESYTYLEVPVVADCDGDGAAELVLTAIGQASNRGTLAVFGNPLWASARRVWNQEAYSVSHVAEDGRIVGGATPRWLTGNDYLGQAAGCACDDTVVAEIETTWRDCESPTACFEAVGLDGSEPPVWDFGDGSPPVQAERPCHAFPTPGAWTVRAVGEDATGCLQTAGAAAILRAPLALAILPPPDCDDGPACFQAVVSGGVPPYEIAWELGDGSPLVRDLTAICHDYSEPGARRVTLQVRDAEGCEALAFVEVRVGLAVPPEVSPPGSPTPLLLRSDGGDLVVAFERTGHVVGLHVGDLAALRTAGYTHQATSECGLTDWEARLPRPAGDTYFLAVAKACGEGSYGGDSFGASRPSAGDLGRPTCP